ncbi:MAG: phospholipase D family protein [candidate division WOR-3 bacterium]|nr:phospholipase D family protein [candidate division WOR-3 bacterium]
MLEPQERSHLMEILRPSDGFRLEFALATTYSLDLMTLLTVPLAFARFEFDAAEDAVTSDPLALLEAVRRYAEHMVVFCQGGRIGLPKHGSQLLTYLEDAVVAAGAAREGGVFHPKIWLLRFVAQDGRVRYRFLCLTRNLTFDRSWDTALSLEGEVQDRTKPYGVNRPLAEFVESLPRLATYGVSDAIESRIAEIAREIRLVRFEPPDGFDDFTFWPLGHNGAKTWPFRSGSNRMLVVAPFMSPGCIGRLADELDELLVVSRLDSLDALPTDSLEAMEEAYFLDDNGVPIEPQDGGVDNELAGLHAKFYLGERGYDVSLWTGSANATDAAFRANVEFLTELSGRRSRQGIDCLMEPSKVQAGFRELLQPYTRKSGPAEVDEVQRALEDQAEEVRAALTKADLAADVAVADGGGYRVTLRARAKVAYPKDMDVRCWPITLSEEVALPLDRRLGATFGSISFEALSAFFAFRVTVTKARRRFERRFVLNLPLLGAPEGRREHVLRSMLNDPEQLMRFLMFLLADTDSEADANLSVLGTVGQSGCVPGFSITSGLLEALLQALASDPSRIDAVERVVADLRRSAGKADLLPEGFDRIWNPIWAARQGMKK